MTSAPGFLSLTSSAFASASTSAISSGVAPLPSNGASTARSSIEAGIASKSMPAFSSSFFRNGLPEARIMRSAMIYAFRQTGAELTRLAAQRNDGCCGFLDRTATDVDHRPAVTRADLPGIGELLGDVCAVRITLRIVCRGSAQNTVLADMRNPLRRCDQANDERSSLQSARLSGMGTPRTIGMLAVLMPRLAR